MPGVHSPATAEGLVITNDGTTVTATDQAGESVWSYGRDREICSVGTAWNKVVVTYRSNAGCGDVVALSAATGGYSATRSAIASEEVVPVTSNDRVGTVSTERVELWRSDLVRTVEYGEVEAKQEAGMQPNEDCAITSALTRTDLLAVSEDCPGDEGVTRLRLQEANPEDSREPEIIRDIAVEGDDARLVAVGQEAATVYVPGPEPTLVSYDADGLETERRPVAPAPPAEETALPFTAATADLPHHMTWFDGERLYLFTPAELTVDHVFEDALGTGVAVGGRLLYPTAEGIAVANWESGMVERVIPVDRAGHTGGVSLGLAGGTVVEKRGDEIVGLV
ncbi:hypothetical protein A605_03825 [Corynebacterium halotolerans YIM 70093 = DSM 44683]|uniref:Uncharacterized protein n=1 Tax=Corynebacterium halotolerans YIM 70093 = DSM 44683 TaxID=1121362 RepID=M1P528_9CORY|nr:hypothetical protein A605_03825 [Corynebacterium halotolerans YIM 70093 = DSM 44683]